MMRGRKRRRYNEQVAGLKGNAGPKTRHYKDKFEEGKEGTPFGRMALPGTVVGP